jgi:hypothetical protein
MYSAIQNSHEEMGQIKYPFWVRLGIWGMSSRMMITVMYLVAILLMLIYLMVGLITLRSGNTELTMWSWAGIIFFFLSATHYYRCRTWMDTYGNWAAIKNHWEGFMGVIIIFIFFFGAAMAIELVSVTVFPGPG